MRLSACVSELQGKLGSKILVEDEDQHFLRDSKFIVCGEIEAYVARCAFQN